MRKFLTSLALAVSLGLVGTGNAEPIITSGDGVLMSKPFAHAEAQAEFRRGIAALLDSDLAAAEQAFLKAAELDPELAAPYLGLADVALQRGRVDDSKMWLTRAEKVEPGSPQPQIGWARFYRTVGAYDEAEKSLQASLRIMPSASGYVELGHLYLTNLDRKGQALRAYQKAAQLAPENAAVRSALAVGYSASGDVQKAIREFSKAAELAPSDPEPHRAIGRLYAERGEYALAAEALDRGLSVDPEHVPTLLDRGDVSVAQGDFPKALEFYEAAAEVAPTAQVLFKLGLAYHFVQRFADAERTYLRVLEKDPGAAEVYNNLAWIALENDRRLDEAITWARKANELSPETASFLDTLGWVQRARGELEEAVDNLEAAIALDQRSADAYYHLGVVYAEIGRKSDAADALGQALEINPSFPKAAEARTRLDAL